MSNNDEKKIEELDEHLKNYLKPHLQGRISSDTLHTINSFKNRFIYGDRGKKLNMNNLFLQMDYAKIEQKVIADILNSPLYEKEKLIQQLEAYGASVETIQAIKNSGKPIIVGDEIVFEKAD